MCGAFKKVNMNEIFGNSYLVIIIKSIINNNSGNRKLNALNIHGSVFHYVTLGL